MLDRELPVAKPASLLKGFEKTVETVRPTAKRQVIFDPDTTGLALIVSPKGKRTFSIVARDPSGKQIWKSIGEPGAMALAEAREKARIGVDRIKAGVVEIFPEEKPEAPPETFRVVAERFVRRWVNKGGKKQDGIPLRSKGEIERQFNAYLYPQWADVPFLSIRRGEVTELIDDMVDENGAVMADRVLATLSKLFNWYRQYDENYVSPIIPEMRRSGSTKDRSRTRILSDDEIRAVWDSAGKCGVFGALVKVGLLTGARRAKLRMMARDDISPDGVWTMPAEAREKNNAGQLKLSPMALEIVREQLERTNSDFVFYGRGDKAFNSFSLGKAELDVLAPTDVPWVFHDLRRTAKSLMSRAGVRPDISERVLGHVIAGVEGVYDRHAYRDEKGEALAAIASLVERILRGEQDNVVPMVAGR